MIEDETLLLSHSVVVVAVYLLYELVGTSFLLAVSTESGSLWA
jgi:hypothetical protein